MLRKISVLLVVSLVLNGCSESSVNQDVVLKNDGRIDTIIIKRTDENNRVICITRIMSEISALRRSRYA
jgi:hypothetical protein